MARYQIEGSVVDTENATAVWEEDTRWDGRNHVSVPTGSQWTGLLLAGVPAGAEAAVLPALVRGAGEPRKADPRRAAEVSREEEEMPDHLGWIFGAPRRRAHLRKGRKVTMQAMKIDAVTLEFSRIAEAAGFRLGPDGRFSLPPTQESCDALSRAALASLGEWEPGQRRWDITLTGSGPIWAYLVIGHALHGLATRLRYAAPNADLIIYSHGLPRE